MVDTKENNKLRYVVWFIYEGTKKGDVTGFIIYKNPLTESGERHRIWGKRALKKGYLKVVEENSHHWVFTPTPKGIIIANEYIRECKLEHAVDFYKSKEFKKEFSSNRNSSRSTKIQYPAGMSDKEKRKYRKQLRDKRK